MSSLKGSYKSGFGELARPIDVAIAAPTDLGYGISHMFAMLISDRKTMNVKIFASVKDSLEWLKIHPLDALEISRGA